MKMPWRVRAEAQQELYKYFNANVRPLPLNPDGTINASARGFNNNDVDAFRHAYVSGVFTQVWRGGCRYLRSTK
jgi:hypothetical protein